MPIKSLNGNNFLPRPAVLFLRAFMVVAYLSGTAYADGSPMASSLTSAEVTSETSAVPTPYLRSCQGMFEAVQSGSVERHFVEGVTDEASAAQLLSDFGLFSKEYRSALLLTLKNHGVTVPEKQEELDLKVAKSVAFAIKKILDLPERQFHGFSLEVLRNLKTIVRAGPTTPDLDESVKRGHGVVASERLARIIRETLSSSKRDLFIKIFEQATRSSLLQTAKPLLLENSLVRRGNVRRYMMLGLSTLCVTFMLASAISDIYLGRYFGTVADLALVLVNAFPAMTNASKVIATRKLRRAAAKMGEIPNNLSGIPIQSLFADYEKSLFDASIFLNDACSKGVCNLTPVQIAYLGHLELTEIAITKIEMNETFKQYSVGFQRLELLREAALNLREAPSSHRNQLIFMARINSLRQSYNSILKQTQAELSTINDRLSEFQNALKQLDSMTYQLTDEDVNDSALNKHEFLIIKFQTDLKLLRDAKSQQTAYLQYLESLGPHLNELEKLTENPGPEADWLFIVNQVLDQIPSNE